MTDKSSVTVGKKKIIEIRNQFPDCAETEDQLRSEERIRRILWEIFSNEEI